MSKYGLQKKFSLTHGNVHISRHFGPLRIFFFYFIIHNIQKWNHANKKEHNWSQITQKCKLFVSAHQNSINTSINTLGTSISIHEIITSNNAFIISMFLVFHKPHSVNTNNRQLFNTTECFPGSQADGHEAIAGWFQTMKWSYVWCMWWSQIIIILSASTLNIQYHKSDLLASIKGKLVGFKIVTCVSI